MLAINFSAGRDNVIVLSEDSYETMRENLYLLESSSNQKWLAESVEQLAAGRTRVQDQLPGTGRPAVFSENAWQDYTAWMTVDQKMKKKIDSLLTDIAASGSGSIGRQRSARLLESQN